MEESPKSMPEPGGKSVNITAFVDASHASDKREKRLHTGYVTFVNRAPIISYPLIGVSVGYRIPLKLKQCKNYLKHYIRIKDINSRCSRPD